MIFPHGIRRGFRTAPLLLIVATVGCATSDSSAEVGCLDEGGVRTSDPVALVACPLAGGSGLRFFVGVRNLDQGPVKVRMRLEPFNQFEVRVQQMGGEALTPQNIWEPASLDLESTTYLLPRDGLQGRIVDLTCLQRDFGPALDPCAAAFEPGAGQVEVWFRYTDMWVCFDDPCDQNQTWTGTLESARRRVTIP